MRYLYLGTFRHSAACLHAYLFIYCTVSSFYEILYHETYFTLDYFNDIFEFLILLNSLQHS